jgi:hypothetical protein
MLGLAFVWKKFGPAVKKPILFLNIRSAKLVQSLIWYIFLVLLKTLMVSWPQLVLVVEKCCSKVQNFLSKYSQRPNTRLSAFQMVIFRTKFVSGFLMQIGGQTIVNRTNLSGFRMVKTSLDHFIVKKYFLMTVLL